MLSEMHLFESDNFGKGEWHFDMRWKGCVMWGKAFGNHCFRIRQTPSWWVQRGDNQHRCQLRRDHENTSPIYYLGYTRWQIPHQCSTFVLFYVVKKHANCSYRLNNVWWPGFPEPSVDSLQGMFQNVIDALTLAGTGCNNLHQAAVCYS